MLSSKSRRGHCFACAWLRLAAVVVAVAVAVAAAVAVVVVVVVVAVVVAGGWWLVAVGC